MKRIDSYLLTHYPLLWNLRVHLIWPAILILHGLYFFSGFTSASFPGIDYGQRIHPDGETAAFSILLSVLAGVGWLLLYFRNNALKSFYPLQRGRLVAELLLVFATCFALASVSGSFTVGKVLRLRQLTAQVNLEEDRRIVRLAEHFLPYQLADFSKFNECHGAAQYPVADDSGRLPTDTFSYLNYCNHSYRGDGEYSFDTALSLTARHWLMTGQRDSVSGILKQYLQLVKKYGGQYRFDPEMHVNSIFNTPRFELRYSLSVYKPHEENEQAVTETAVSATEDPRQQAPQLKYSERTAYVEGRNAEQALSLISQARNTNAGIFGNIVYLYTALVLTILIFSFRLTGMRTWFIAVIGAGLLTAIVGLMIAVASGGIGSLMFVIILELAFTAMAVIGQNTGWTRRWAGVMLLWSIAGMPFMLPCVWTLLRDATYPEYSISINGMVSVPSPFHTFLSTYQDEALYANVFLALILIAAFYIPLARKWQAMPEE